MKLGQEHKKKLIDTASDVYKAFTALHFFKERIFSFGSDRLTLLKICEDAIANKEFKKAIILDDQAYELELTPDEKQGYSVSLKRPLTKPSVRKPLIEYSSEEALALLADQHFYLEKDAKSQYHVKNRIHDKVDIGGIGKMDLYNTHLVTLNKIIEKIQSEEDISNLLVALATGSGKTFVQTLWLLVIYLSGSNAIFTLPDKLITQFQRDLRRILPNDLVNKFAQLKQKDEDSKAKTALEPLKSKNAESHIVIASGERILDKHYQQLLTFDPEFTSLVFDEVHLLMEIERQRVRLMELAKKFLSMLLTATPSEEIYDSCGKCPVAAMSNKQKVEAGQGQFPVIFRDYARNMTDRNKLKDYRFWTRDFWQNMLRSFFLRFANAVQGEPSSAAATIVEKLPFYIHRKPGEKDLRWSLQVPMARKMLIIVDDNEALVNLSRAIDKSDTQDRYVYSGGAVVNRSDISNFFLLPNIEDAIIDEDIQRNRDGYLAGLTEAEQKIGKKLAKRSLKSQLKENIFHNMVEYVLSDITGLNEIAHNKLRQESPEAFERMIREQFKRRDTSYYQKDLAAKIDDHGAKEIAEILSKLSKALQHIKQHNKKYFSAFADNWGLDDELINKINIIEPGFSSLFNAYADRHFMISTMKRMKHAETPVEESQPFFGLEEDYYCMYKDGVLIDKAKRRQHSAMETLNDWSCESRFAPKYLRVSEEELKRKKLSIGDICDNYFGWGFVGCLVSNEHGVGFSDPRLQTVVNISEKTLSSTNNPGYKIQVVGRLRGLDPKVVPAFIDVQGRGHESIFDLEHLKLEDYYPQLFSAQDQYNKKFISELGKAVGQEIITWYNANVHADETIDADRLEKQVLKIITKALRHLNNNNNHNIQLSRSQITTVISSAMSTLKEEIARIKKPYDLPLSVSTLGSIFNFIAEIYFSIVRIVPAFQRLMYSWYGERTALPEGAVSKVHPDDVYIKVINNTDFKRIVSKIGIAKEFKDWLARMAKGIENTIEKNPVYYLKPEFAHSFSTHKEETLIPLLTNFVIADKKELVANALRRLPNLTQFIKEHTQPLEELARFVSEEQFGDEFEEKLLVLFQKIPGLEELTAVDIVNAPKQIKDNVLLFKQNPLGLLQQSESLKHHMLLPLAAYLKGPFLKLAANLFLDEDYQQLQSILAQEGQAEKFLQHLFAKASENNLLDLKNVDQLVDEFRVCFSLDDFDSIKGRSQVCANRLPRMSHEYLQSYFSKLSDSKLTQLARIVQSNLLPSLVNVFPLASRDEILSDITFEKLKQVIRDNGVDLVKLMSGKMDEERVAGLFKLLVSVDLSKSLPEPLNIEDEKEKSKQFVLEQFAGIKRLNRLKLVGKKLLTPSSWKRTVMSWSNVYDEPIANLIKSDPFIDAISILFPFDQWSQLKKLFNQDSQTTLRLARALIAELRKSNDSSSFEPETFVRLVNETFSTKFTSSINAVKNTASELSGIQEDLISSLSGHGIVPSIRDELLPLLAAFIIDERARQNFLAEIPRDYERLVRYFFANKDKFAAIQNSDKKQSCFVVLELINGLLCMGRPLFTLKQIKHPQEKAEADGAQIVTDLIQETVGAYVVSDHFSTMLARLFNPTDLAKLKEFLQDKNRVAYFAKTVAETGLDKLDDKMLLAILQKEDSLKDIKTLDTRVNIFGGFLMKLKGLNTQALDYKKFFALVHKTVTPILFHKKFYALLNDLIGSFNAEDLSVMFHALDDKDPRKSAASILQLKALIETQNQEELQRQFLTPPDETSINIDALPITAAMEKLGLLIEELMNCHCYYYQHDHKGSYNAVNLPKLHQFLSQALRNIKVGPDKSSISFFSRRIIFFQGVRNGLPESAQISADSYQNRVKIFERINNHILRPVWWSMNTSRLGYALVTTGHAIAVGLRAFGFGILNGLKRIVNSVFPEYCVVTQANPVSRIYDAAAFATTKRINELASFDAAKVADPKCLRDVVAHAEDFISGLHDDENVEGSSIRLT